MVFYYCSISTILQNIPINYDNSEMKVIIYRKQAIIEKNSN